MKTLFFAIGCFLFSSVTSANFSCRLTIHREACPGREIDAFAPYGGKNPTYEGARAKTKAECVKAAESSAVILRKKILKKITVTGLFEEEDIGSHSKQAPCGWER
jgi:hypothetical protein